MQSLADYGSDDDEPAAPAPAVQGPQRPPVITTTADGKRVVRLQLPRPVPTGDDDEDDEAPKKKARDCEPGASAGLSFRAFLPAPKYGDMGTAAGANGSKIDLGGPPAERPAATPMAAPTPAAPAADSDDERDDDGDAPSPTPARGPTAPGPALSKYLNRVDGDAGRDYFGVGGAAAVSPFGAVVPPPRVASTAAAAAPSVESPPPPCFDAPRVVAAQATRSARAVYAAVNGGDAEAILAATVAAERARLARKGRGRETAEYNPLAALTAHPMREVSAAALTAGMTERALAPGAAARALGPEHAQQLKAQAGAAPGAVARSKHQIGSLFHAAKMKEIEKLDTKSAAAKSKSATRAKYGW